MTAAAERAGRVELELRHVQQDRKATVTTDAVVCATGYRERNVDELLAPLAGRIERDAAGRIVVDEDYRVRLETDGSLFVQNAERHTHGVGAPDLGLTAWRSARILNTVCGRAVYPLPDRTAFTTLAEKPRMLPTSAKSSFPTMTTCPCTDSSGQKKSRSSSSPDMAVRVLAEMTRPGAPLASR